MDSFEGERYVALRGGLTIAADPYLLALELERRGFTLTRQGAEVLSVQPYGRLTTEDCERIRRWKAHLLALLDYHPPEFVQ